MAGADDQDFLSQLGVLMALNVPEETRAMVEYAFDLSLETLRASGYRLDALQVPHG